MALTPTKPIETPAPRRESVKPPTVLLLGEPGNGKTFSLPSILLNPKIEKLFYLYTDPGGEESLIDGAEYYDVPISKIHWHYIPPASQGWDALEDLVKKTNAMDYESLAGLKSGIKKSEHRQMFEIIAACANFPDDRTGDTFGPIDAFPSTYAFAFDSLTGLNKIARESTVGAKPTLHQGEWGVAMSMEENFLRKLTADMKCPTVIVGHLDKSLDPVQGRMLLQVSLLGNKLAPQIPHMFSDVIYAYAEGGKFYWSTQSDSNLHLKTRNLKIADKLNPVFSPIISKWQERLAKAEGGEPPH